MNYVRELLQNFGGLTGGFQSGICFVYFRELYEIFLFRTGSYKRSKSTMYIRFIQVAFDPIF